MGKRGVVAKRKGGQMNKWVARLLIIIAILIILPVWVWAVRNCIWTCAEWKNGGCVRNELKCVGSDIDENAPTPDYGAIAYGKTKKAYGTSFKWASRARAEQMALQKCGQYGNDCEIAVWFKNQCGAVVTRSDSQIFYWGLGETEGEAKSVAMKECAKNNGHKCEVLIAQCASNK